MAQPQEDPAPGLRSGALSGKALPSRRQDCAAATYFGQKELA
jgi:hypothetical protein